MKMKVVLLGLIAGALVCRLLMPLTSPDVRAGVRLRLSARAFPRSYPLTDLTELDEWVDDYAAYQTVDASPDPSVQVT